MLLCAASQLQSQRSRLKRNRRIFGRCGFAEAAVSNEGPLSLFERSFPWAELSPSGVHQAAGWSLWGTAEARRRSSRISRVLWVRNAPADPLVHKQLLRIGGRSKGQGQKRALVMDPVFGSKGVICLCYILNIRDTDRVEEYMQRWLVRI